ncbi:acyl-CoA dehydrogenase family protein [Methylopila henanensis]|uniref:Acyl-CoA dehydrogenase family protein n=1 Tax=Methylopila henanensis TaxID=873516 RepID=A0ABW4KED4_9HYPH
MTSASNVRHLAPEGVSDLDALFAFVAEGAAERDRDRILPFEALDRIRAARLGALRLPKAEGGQGVSLRELLEVVIRLSAADPNVSHALRNHFTFVERFARSRTAPNREKWAKIVASGAIVGLANTELSSPTIGAVTYQTALTPDGDGWRLDGVKYYSTGTIFSDHVLVRASAPDGRTVSAVVPTNRDGVDIVDDWDGAGQRLTGSGTTYLRNVRVEPDEAIFDAPGVGYGYAYHNTLAQLLVTGVVAGILRNVLSDAVTLLRSRKDRHFYYAAASSPAEDPLLQEIVGEISAASYAADAVVLAAADVVEEVARARDRGLPDAEIAHKGAEASAKAKLVVDELTIKSASRLFDVGGASATKRTKNLDRHWRNARTLASHNPAALKARALGAYELAGEPLPAQGFF